MNSLLSVAIIASFVATTFAASFTERQVDDCDKRDLRCLKRRELSAIYGEIKRGCDTFKGYWCENKNREVAELTRRLFTLPKNMPPEEAEEFGNDLGEEEEEEDKREAGGCASRHLGFWCKKKRDLIQEKVNEIRSAIEKFDQRKRAPAPAKPGCQSKYLGFWC